MRVGHGRLWPNRLWPILVFSVWPNFLNPKNPNPKDPRGLTGVTSSMLYFHLVVLFFKEGQNTETLKLAKVGLAIVGRIRMAKVGQKRMAKVGLAKSVSASERQCRRFFGFLLKKETSAHRT